MAEIKSVSELVPTITKITDHKLTWINYLDWSKTIRLYLRSIEKEDHLTDDPPTTDSKKTWLRDDARLFFQIRNSIDSEIIPSINHCELVKELMDYLDFLYSGKGNISCVYEVCKAFYRSEKQDRPLKAYFMDFKRMYEELNVLMPLTADLKVQHKQREQMAIMSFLTGLPPEYDTVRSQILSGSEISDLQDVFSRVMRAENLLPPAASIPTSALLSKGTYETRSPIDNRGGPTRGGSKQGGAPSDSSGVVCYYCKEPGHTKRTCRKLQNKQQRNNSAHVATQASDTVTISAAEYAQLKSTTPSVSAAATTGSFDEADYW
ncbi:uncharacterized protein LOC114721283 [Neltuma alba]|uniref:uncharacterized protein LOC114721283 n=2 Tax=Neltuma alba TaxID=207710 RepID=UPI0010A41F27|nr:uncharacterized protein LOC114721283 [Prosopis alba]